MKTIDGFSVQVGSVCGYKEALKYNVREYLHLVTDSCLKVRSSQAERFRIHNTTRYLSA